MTLDRWAALVLLLIFAVYGYTAFFTMDAGLPPIMQRNPVWPSTFPKVLSVAGALASLFVLVGLEKSKDEQNSPDADIDYRRITDYKLGQALTLLTLMVVYALALRPAGFIVSSSLFLILSAVVLGERNWKVLIPVAITASIGVWYLVQQVLDIFLRPLPYFLG